MNYNMSMTAKLVQLVASSQMNAYFPIHSASYPLIIPCTTNTSHEFRRNADLLTISGLIVPSKYMNEISYLKITISGKIVWNIPFSILMISSSIEYKSDLAYITINDKLFGKPDIFMNVDQLNQTTTDTLLLYNPTKFEIPLVSTIKSSVRALLDSPFNFDYDIVVGYKFLEVSDRRKLKQISNYYKINQYQTFIVPINKIAEICPRHVSSDIFIEIKYPITNFCMMLNGQRSESFDPKLINFFKCLISRRDSWSKNHSLMISLCLGKILPMEIIKEIERYCDLGCKYLYRFPININSALHEYDEHSTLNFTRIDSVNVEIRTETEQTQINDCVLYVKNQNILTVDDSEAYVHF